MTECGRHDQPRAECPTTCGAEQEAPAAAVPSREALTESVKRDLLEAARDMLAQFAAGMFVRDTDSDGCSDWALKAVGPLRALAALKAAVDKADGVPYRASDFTE